MPSSGLWALPKRPDDPAYVAVLRDIQAEENPTFAVEKFRTICEEDFWFFCRYASSFGRYVISDQAHPRHGHLWCEELWVFDRCRDIQAAWDAGETGVFWNWSRYHFKTELITKLHTIWVLLKKPSTTVAILTYKIDQTGEAMFQGIRDELERNEVLHTHWPDVLTAEAIRKFKTTALTIERPLGPREPSVAIHSLDKMPTSLHVDLIKIDDAVVRETVRTQEAIDSTHKAMSQATFLGKDHTVKWWIGTIWDQYDPYVRSLNDGRFTRRDWWTPFGRNGVAEGEPILRSERFLKEWRREASDFDWSCQMLGSPIAREMASFQLEWLKTYRNAPVQEREGKAVYILCDTSGGKRSGDFACLYVQGLGEDRLRYSLDMWREKVGLADFIDLLFDLVKKWRPEATLIEQFGASAYYEAVKREQEHRQFRFKVAKLPDLRRPKEERIEQLQVAQRNGEIMWPEAGFGHGSRSPRDNRDVFEQYRVDEYRLWTPVPGSVLHDDMLDTVAWSIQPEVRSRMRFPETTRGDIDEALLASAGARASELSRLSPWVTL